MASWEPCPPLAKFLILVLILVWLEDTLKLLLFLFCLFLKKRYLDSVIFQSCLSKPIFLGSL